MPAKFHANGITFERVMVLLCWILSKFECFPSDIVVVFQQGERPRLFRASSFVPPRSANDGIITVMLWYPGERFRLLGASCLFASTKLRGTIGVPPVRCPCPNTSLCLAFISGRIIKPGVRMHHGY